MSQPRPLVLCHRKPSSDDEGEWRKRRRRRLFQIAMGWGGGRV
jgi:hypothetical protein